MEKNFERERRQELMQRIRAAHIPVAPESEKCKIPEILISQDYEAYESTIFDLNGGSGLILPLRITSQMPLFVFSRFHIDLDLWSDVWFRALDENCREEWPAYEFYGRSNLKFSRSQCINHVIAEKREFRRGQTAKGLLLAISAEPVRDDIFRGTLLQVSIGIFDQFEHKHSARISLRVERENILLPTAHSSRRRLFSRPDFKENLEEGD